MEGPRTRNGLKIYYEHTEQGMQLILLHEFAGTTSQWKVHLDKHHVNVKTIHQLKMPKEVALRSRLFDLTFDFIFRYVFQIQARHRARPKPTMPPGAIQNVSGKRKTDLKC